MWNILKKRTEKPSEERTEDKPFEETNETNEINEAPSGENGGEKEANICSCQTDGAETSTVSESTDKCLPSDDTDAERVGGQENGVFSEELFGQLYTLIERFPTEKAAEDVASEAFRRFAAGKSGDVVSIYADYLDFKRAFSAQSADSPTETEVSEECYSAYAGGSALPDYAQSLTARQMQIARESGMSYREYAELLQSVPTGRKRF